MNTNPTYLANKRAVEAGKTVYQAVIEETKHPMDIVREMLAMVDNFNLRKSLTERNLKPQLCFLITGTSPSPPAPCI